MIARPAPRRRASALALVALIAGACGAGEAEQVADDATAGQAADAVDHAHDHAADDHEDVAPDVDAIIVPDFELANIDGSTSRLSDYRGHPVAVVFMHTY